ncbi:MAG: PIG-L family deacetylase [Planctomycetes bacterium]|nr:PIG-L family deacetylase [Planctomycetota bacterium]
MRSTRLALSAVVAIATATSPSTAQHWRDSCGQTAAGAVALRQAVLDARSDSLVLLVASHPDDRYVLPAVWLRYCHGARIAVLLATRGGGGQNSIGPESGDALERIRTLETEAGCSHFDGEVWYLDRPDGGYRRTAEETYAEWGEEDSVRDLVRLIRTIRPDAILTTHHRQESHGHDLALVDLLTRAVPLAGRSDFMSQLAPCSVPVFALGATGDSPMAVAIPADRLEPVRGASLRYLAWDILRSAHRSPGEPAPMETVFEPQLRFELLLPGPARQFPFDRLPGVFDVGTWPGTAAAAERVRRFLETDLPELAMHGRGTEAVVAAIVELRQLRSQAGVSDDADRRLQRRIEALERVLLLLSDAKIALDVPPETFAIGGQELSLAVHIHVASGIATKVTVEGLDGVTARLEASEDGTLTLPHGGARRVEAVVGVPLPVGDDPDPMAERFRGDRFVPPVRIRFRLSFHGIEVPTVVTVPVEQRAPVEVTVVPRLLLLPESRRELQFSVGVVRKMRFPIEGDLEVRAPAGYAIQQDRRRVELRKQQGDLFQFEVKAAEGRRAGVDVLRVAFNGRGVATLPVHKVNVEVSDVRVGVLRGRDDTLPGILGVGGLGLAWSELSDADVAAGNLGTFDTIVVDVRALRDRPAARRGFRRLLEFADMAGHRLVVFYHKDVEFNPGAEGFLGAPLQPFQIGKARVTRADAPVTVLRPHHVLLNHPNEIRPWDWDGWEQERALYLPSVYSGGFEELLELNDPGQPAEQGALLYARSEHGGEYVYCALALWRQLKKLHPGAVRLLANLLTPSAP